ncbi:MAG TPA: hypothetical protein VE173_09915 [Longimicrobiales bacterium]|nr:hypothetical protein [Longimicrobiales bacterium]
MSASRHALPSLGLFLASLALACSDGTDSPTAPPPTTVTARAPDATHGKPKFVTVQAGTTLHPMQSGFARAWCPDGSVATGGGFTMEQGLMLLGSHPVDPGGDIPGDGTVATGWNVFAVNPGGTGPHDLQSYVVCSN